MTDASNSSNSSDQAHITIPDWFEKPKPGPVQSKVALPAWFDDPTPNDNASWNYYDAWGNRIPRYTPDASKPIWLQPSVSEQTRKALKPPRPEGPVVLSSKGWAIMVLIMGLVLLIGTWFFGLWWRLTLTTLTLTIAFFTLYDPQQLIKHARERNLIPKLQLLLVGILALIAAVLLYLFTTL